METINITPEIGLTLKNFRIEYGKTAKEISDFTGKAPSYFSKLEKGDIKKIEIEFLLTILNFITENNDGLTNFLEKLYDKYKNDNLDDDSIIIFINLDDVIREINIDSKFTDYVNNLISKNNLSVDLICNNINSNNDLNDLSEKIYTDLPFNTWTNVNNQNTRTVIKLNISLDLINNILNRSILRTNYITLLAILYSTYKLIDMDSKEKQHQAIILLKDFGMNNIRSKGIKVENLDSSFEGLKPSSINLYQNIITNLKIMLAMNESYTSKKLEILESNFEKDLGFTFAFMTSDLSNILSLSKESKSKFLNELKDLMQKTSQTEQQSLDLYLDD